MTHRLPLLVLLCACAVGCVRKPELIVTDIPDDPGPPPPVQQPYGSHRMPYAKGSILPSGSRSELDDATRKFYDYWKKTYLKSGCEEGQYYVAADTKPTNLTVSEAHGYGMIILALMAGHDPNAKLYFDGMIRYFREHESALTPGLMAWYQSKTCRDTGGDNSATDGDLDIAYGLLLADRQWGSCHGIEYITEARRVIGAISRRGLSSDARWILLGDWVTKSDGHYNGTRPSDFMMGHLRSYQAATGDTLWSGVVDNLYWIAEQVQVKHAPTTGLIPDFVEAPGSAPRPAAAGFLEGHRDGSYAYNACRIPLRLGTDYVVNGDPRAKRIMQRLNGFVQQVSGGDPTALRAGYRLDGEPMTDYETMAFTGPFGVGAMVDPANQAWLDALWQHTVSRKPERYYEDTLKMLSMLVMSGNWWAPEKVANPCAGEPK